MASSLPPRPRSPSPPQTTTTSSATSPPPYKRARLDPALAPAALVPMGPSSDPSPSASRPCLHTLRIPRPTEPAPKRAVPFQQPSCFTSYSVTAPAAPSSHRTVHLSSNRCLARWAPCPPGADLAYGFERCVWPDEARKAQEGLDDLVASIAKFERDKLGGQKVLAKGKEGFVSFRGTMTKILTAPYDDEPLELSAQVVGGNIYLEQHKGPPREMDDRGKRMTYNGFSFESYSTQPAPGEAVPSGAPPGWSGDVDLNDEWCAVVKTSLDGMRMVLGGEVDCLEGPFDGTLANAVELKTAVQPLYPAQVRRFEQKLLRFWAQSFLLGIPTVVIGFRRPNPPIVDVVQRFETMGLPRLVRPQAAMGQQRMPPPSPWEPQTCLAFAADALRFLRQTILPGGEADDEGRARVWAVRLGGGGGQVECRELEAGGPEWEGRVRERERERGARWGILPDWVKEGSAAAA